MALTMWALGSLLSAVLCFRQPGRGGAGYKERLVMLNGPWQKGILVSFCILILGILTSLYSRHLFLHSSWGWGGSGQGGMISMHVFKGNVYVSDISKKQH